MHKIWYVIFMVFINTLIFSISYPINTTLIIIEETENEFIAFKEQTPFTEGVFTAMWETELIFFDMRIDQEIPLLNKIPDIRPFIGDAQSSGADSILIFKLKYETYEVGGKLHVKIDEIPYILYSLQNTKVLKSGVKKVGITKSVENTSKNQILNSLGKDMVDVLF